jgi:hypothetical protein
MGKGLNLGPAKPCVGPLSYQDFRQQIQNIPPIWLQVPGAGNRSVMIR